MIVLDLLCKAGHRFEGWFASSAAFEQQRSNALLNCPLCGTHKVQRLPSAPHVQRASTAAEPRPPRDAAASGAEYGELIAHLRGLAAQGENVGRRFPEEARRIHYGDAEARTIRGEASVADTLSLLDEGISVLPLPAPKDDQH